MKKFLTPFRLYAAAVVLLTGIIAAGVQPARAAGDRPMSDVTLSGSNLMQTGTLRLSGSGSNGAQIVISGSSNGLAVESGLDAYGGVAVLVAGSSSLILNKHVAAGVPIFLGNISSSGTGRISTLVLTGGFKIISSDVAETSSIPYLVVPIVSPP